jgi:hypothetical protein
MHSRASKIEKRMNKMRNVLSAIETTVEPAHTLVAN